MAKIICPKCEKEIEGGYMLLNDRKVHYNCYREHQDAILENEDALKEATDILSPNG